MLSGPEGAAPAGTADAIAIYVGPVAVPESVDRAQMVIQGSANQVELSEEHRWAEPLKTAIPRVVAEHLMRELGTPRVMASRVGTSLDMDYRVALEGSASRRRSRRRDVELLLPSPQALSGRASPLERDEPPGSADGIAAAHSRALRAWRDIAALSAPVSTTPIHSVFCVL